MKACERNGLIIRAVAGNSVALCPPLIITREEVDEMLDRLARALGRDLGPPEGRRIGCFVIHS